MPVNYSGIEGELDELDILIPFGQQVLKLILGQRAQHVINNAILSFNIAMTVRGVGFTNTKTHRSESCVAC
jgi:hypothetical protein